MSRYTNEANRIITQENTTIGPSTASAFLYGPVGAGLSEEEKFHDSKIVLNSQSTEILTEIYNSSQRIYSSQIEPLLKHIVNFFFDITGGSADVSHDYRKFSPLELKLFCKDLVQSQNLNITTDALSEINDVTHVPVIDESVTFSYEPGSSFLLMKRQKSFESIKRKYQEIYEGNFNKTLTKRIDLFMMEVLRSPTEYWEENNFQEYWRQFNQITRLMLSDFLGISIVYLDRNKAEGYLDSIQNMGQDFTMKGFHTVKHKYKPHRNNREEGRPAGLAHIFTPLDFLNFPIEVKFLDPKSFIYGFFGEFSHDKYAKDNKRASSKIDSIGEASRRLAYL